MSKKLEVIDGIFTITDITTDTLEFRSLAEITFLQIFSAKYYFYYDSFEGDNIRRTRSVDYNLGELLSDTESEFLTEQDLVDWVNDHLTGSSGGGGGPGGDTSLADYRSEYEPIGKLIYVGYNVNGNPYIYRVDISNNIEWAQNLKDLEADWTNRLTLTYV